MKFYIQRSHFQYSPSQLEYLFQIAVILRKNRCDNGSLQLDQPKLAFSLDETSGMPRGLSLYEVGFYVIVF